MDKILYYIPYTSVYRCRRRRDCRGVYESFGRRWRQKGKKVFSFRFYSNGMHARRSDSSQWSCERLLVHIYIHIYIRIPLSTMTKNVLTYPVGIDMYEHNNIYTYKCIYTYLYVLYNAHTRGTVYILLLLLLCVAKTRLQAAVSCQPQHNTPNWNFEDIKDIPR